MAEELERPPLKDIYRKLIADNETNEVFKKYSYNSFRDRMLNNPDASSEVADFLIDRGIIRDKDDWQQNWLAPSVVKQPPIPTKSAPVQVPTLLQPAQPSGQPSLTAITGQQAVTPMAQGPVSLAPNQSQTLTDVTTEQVATPTDQGFSQQETQRARNETRSTWDKTKDFFSSIGASADNMLTKIKAGETLLGAAQRRLLTFGDRGKQAAEQEIRVRKDITNYLKKIDQEYADAEWKRNINGSVLDVIEKGELNRLPEAVGKTVGDAAMQIFPTMLTGGYSMYAQTLPDAYKAGVEEVAKKTDRTPEEVIEAGDDAMIVANISAGIQAALEKVSGGIFSKSIASKGGYRAVRDWVIKKTGNKTWSRAAGGVLATGLQAQKEGIIEVTQELTGIAGEQLGASTSAENFAKNLSETLQTPEADRRLNEAYIGGIVGGGGLIVGGKAYQVAANLELYTPAIISKATQLGPANVIDIVDRIKKGEKPTFDEVLPVELWAQIWESEAGPNEELTKSKEVLNAYIESERNGLVDLTRTQQGPETTGEPIIDNTDPTDNAPQFRPQVDESGDEPEELTLEEKKADIERRRQEEFDSVNILKGGYIPIEGYEAFAKRVNEKYDNELAALLSNETTEIEPDGPSVLGETTEATGQTGGGVGTDVPAVDEQGTDQEVLTDAVAEIEKRRDEEFNEYKNRRANRFVKYNPEGFNAELTQGEVDDAEELIQAAIDNGSVTAEKLFKMLRSQGYVYSIDNTAETALAYLKNRLNGKTNTKVNGTLLDDTKNKYDAEIAALQSPAPIPVAADETGGTTADVGTEPVADESGGSEVEVEPVLAEEVAVAPAEEEVVNQGIDKSKTYFELDGNKINVVRPNGSKDLYGEYSDMDEANSDLNRLNAEYQGTENKQPVIKTIKDNLGLSSAEIEVKKTAGNYLVKPNGKGKYKIVEVSNVDRNGFDNIRKEYEIKIAIAEKELEIKKLSDSLSKTNNPVQIQKLNDAINKSTKELQSLRPAIEPTEPTQSTSPFSAFDPPSESMSREQGRKAINEVNQLGIQNPLNPKEVVVDGVRVEVVPYEGKGIEIQSIESTNKGQGLGTRVLNKIQDIADKNQVSVVVYPTQIEATTEDQLRKWYAKNDFVEQENGEMIYSPKPQSRDEIIKSNEEARKNYKKQREAKREERLARKQQMIDSGMSDEEATAILTNEVKNEEAAFESSLPKVPDLLPTQLELDSKKNESDFKKMRQETGAKRSDRTWGNNAMGEDMGYQINTDNDAAIFIKPQEEEVDTEDGRETAITGTAIELVYVSPESRGMGKAKALIQKVVSAADKTGTTLHLDIAPQDKSTTTEGLRKLYEGFGFTIDNFGHGVRKPNAAPKQSPFESFNMKGEEGRKARAALKEKVGKTEFAKMEAINKKAPEILKGLEERGVIRIECP